MTGRRRFGSPLLALLLGALLGPVLQPAPARAQDFLDAYQSGLEAIEQEDWETAADRMETAGRERSEPAQRLLRYLHFKPYVPWFYLGVARYRQGDCAGALEAWDESERRGVATGLDDLWPSVVDGRAECALRARRREDARRAAAGLSGLLDRADRAAEAAASLAEEGRAAGIWNRGDPSPAERLRRAREEIAAARQSLRRLGDGDIGDRSPTRVAQEAERRTRSALETLEALRAQVESHREEVRARVGDERARLRGSRTAATRLLDETEPLGEQVPEVAEARTALRDVLDASEGIAPDTPLAELNRLRRQVDSAASRLREAAAPPPEPLLEAADAFFAGDLERAVEILERPGIEDSEDPRIRAHSALLRAAARFSLWQAGGGADLDLLEAARQDVLAARAEDPDLTPLPRAFSPRFLAFFEANASEPPDDSG